MTWLISFHKETILIIWIGNRARLLVIFFVYSLFFFRIVNNQKFCVRLKRMTPSDKFNFLEVIFYGKKRHNRPVITKTRSSTKQKVPNKLNWICRSNIRSIDRITTSRSNIRSTVRITAYSSKNYLWSADRITNSN